jgi:small-conductance mechanosensitive channel
MDYVIIQRIVYSAITMLAIYLLLQLLKRYARQTQRKFHIRKSRYFAIRRLLTVFSLLLSLVVLILIWNVDLKHVWVSATGVLALIAVAFVAVWSLVGNILAGVIIYFTSPFKIEDTIEIMPDGIRGSVLAINTFYTVLMTEHQNYINVPNSLLFQKYIQVIRTQSTEQQPHLPGCEPGAKD